MASEQQCQHVDKITVYDGSYTGEMGDVYNRIVQACPDCGLMFVSIDRHLEYVDFEFGLTTIEQLMSVAQPILVRCGLRIVSAAQDK